MAVMQAQLSTDLLIAGASDVFETMVFMAVEPATDERRIQGPATQGIVSFTGPIEGCLTVCFSDACAAEVAANMLGLSRPNLLSPEMLDDAVGEITNMVMGTVKTATDMFGAVQISTPSIVHGRRLSHELSGRPNRIDAVVMIDDRYPAELSLLWRERFESA